MENNKNHNKEYQEYTTNFEEILSFQEDEEFYFMNKKLPG